MWFLPHMVFVWFSDMFFFSHLAVSFKFKHGPEKGLETHKMPNKSQSHMSWKSETQDSGRLPTSLTKQ